MSDGQNQGEFPHVSSSRGEASRSWPANFKVSVDFEESKLRLTIAERQGTTP